MAAPPPENHSEICKSNQYYIARRKARQAVHVLFTKRKKNDPKINLHLF